MGFERSIANRELVQLVISYVDLNRLAAVSGSVFRLERRKSKHGVRRFPRGNSFEAGVARHVGRRGAARNSPSPSPILSLMIQ